MLDRFRNRYFLDDKTASAIWEAAGFFVRPENQNGDHSITSVIMKAIVDESKAERIDSPDTITSFEVFLSELERIFNEQRSLDLYENRDFVGAFMVWNDLVQNEYFDPRHPLVNDKPYYRTLVASGICQCILSCIQAINSGQARECDGDSGEDAYLSVWTGRVLMLCERIVEIEPLMDTDAGYFRRYPEGVAAQNHNIWVCLESLGKWFNGWSPSVLKIFSDRSESEIERIVRTMDERERIFRVSDKK